MAVLFVSINPKNPPARQKKGGGDQQMLISSEIQYQNNGMDWLTCSTASVPPVNRKENDRDCGGIQQYQARPGGFERRGYPLLVRSKEQLEL